MTLPADMIKSAHDVKLGPTPLEISGTVNASLLPAELSVERTQQTMSPCRAAKLLAAISGVALSPGTTVTGNATSTSRPEAPQNKPALMERLQRAIFR